MRGSTVDTKYYSLEQVAALFGLHPATIRRHISSGRLKAYRVGTQIRIRSTDLDSYLRPIPTAERND